MQRPWWDDQFSYIMCSKQKPDGKNIAPEKRRKRQNIGPTSHVAAIRVVTSAKVPGKLPCGAILLRNASPKRMKNACSAFTVDQASTPGRNNSKTVSLGRQKDAVIALIMG